MIGAMWRRLLRFGFRLLYNELAFLYDGVSWLVSFGQWRCWQRSIIRYMPPPDSGWVLELAHGTGNLQVDLLQRGYRTIALDLSPYMGRLAGRKLARHGLRTDFVRGNALHLPFASGSISTLVCTFPTPFILEPDTLSEIQRVLSEGGRGIIVLTGLLRGGGLRPRFVERLYRITGQRNAQFSEGPIRDAFAKYGFEVKTAEVPCQDSAAQLVILTKDLR